MGDYDAVKITAALINMAGDLLPLFRLHIGRIQTHNIFHGDLVMGAQLINLKGHHTGGVGHKAVGAGCAGDSSTGGQQQNMFFLFHKPQCLS